jgi:hypothetical protein
MFLFVVVVSYRFNVHRNDSVHIYMDQPTARGDVGGTGRESVHEDADDMSRLCVRRDMTMRHCSRSFPEKNDKSHVG